MGNSSQKLAEKCSLLNKNEVPIVASSFKLVSKNSERIKEDELKKFWGTQMDPRLSQYITNFLFGPLGNRNPAVEFQRFAELYVYCVRGTIDERVTVLMCSLGQSEQEANEIAYPLIKEVRLVLVYVCYNQITQRKLIFFSFSFDSVLRHKKVC